jgi:hypothetical protein
MKFIALGVLAALLLTQCVEARAQQDLDRITVQGRPDYSGIWTPDAEANAQLERQMRKAMRKKMKQAAPRERAPGHEGPGGGSPPPGGGAGGPGGPPGGPPGRAMPQPNAHGVMRQEMDFAAPLQGDLEIVSTESEFRLGRAGGPLTEIAMGRGATELADGHTRVFAAWEKNQFVVEFNTDDGARVTHTYALEDHGNRLRIHTNVAGRMSPVPGGIDMERVFVRKP